MKRMLLLSVVIFCFTVANAQTEKAKAIHAGKNDTTWQNLSVPKNLKRANNGNVKIHTGSGKYNLYATYKNGQVTKYYTLDAKGTKIPVNFAKKEKGCYYCTPSMPEPDGTKLILCWWDPGCTEVRISDKSKIKTAL